MEQFIFISILYYFSSRKKRCNIKVLQRALMGFDKKRKSFGFKHFPGIEGNHCEKARGRYKLKVI